MASASWSAWLGVVGLLLVLVAPPAAAHRSGCHRWHSCPADRGTYVCGDLNYCGQCPDNEYCLAGQARPRPAPSPAPETELVRIPATIVRVVDGDTVDVEVAGRRERVRLIGLNTPESVDPRRPVECFGREAARRARELLPEGARIELEADPSQRERDRYGRLLRYLRLPDGRNFAEVMIAKGYGFEYTFRFPYRYQAEFKAAEREAREQQRGLWAPGACT